MTQTDSVKTGCASWKGMTAVFIAVFMLAMVFSPAVSGEQPGMPAPETALPEAPAESGIPEETPGEFPLEPPTVLSENGEIPIDAKNLSPNAQQQSVAPQFNAVGVLPPEEGSVNSSGASPDPESPILAPVHGQVPEPELNPAFVPEDFSAELVLPPADGSATVPDPTVCSAPIYPTPQAILWDNGPLVNVPGGGFGGADASRLQTGLGMNTLGFGAQYTIPNRMADDFIVDSTWTIDSFTFFSYQTGSTTTSTFTGVYVQIWDAAPNGGGAVIWGDMTTNRMTSTAFTGIYRDSETTPVVNNRPIMDVVADTTGLTLPPGTYWVDFAFTGSGASGPWMPPVTITGMTTTGNALQYTQSSGAWGNAIDSGTGTPQQGAPFIIDGTAGSLITLMPDYQSDYCSFNGEQVDYPLTLTNDLPTTEVFDLTAANNAWPVEFLVPSTVPTQMTNPGFETGDLSGWTTTDLTIPYVPIQVSGAGNTCPDMGDGFITAPTEGSWSLQNGWDGNGPGHITAGQDYDVPALGTTTLTFDYRASWDLVLVPATLDRIFTVNIEPAGGGAPLQTDLMLTAIANTYLADTGILQGSVDLTPYAGTTVFINFDWWVPEVNSGPAYFELDNIKMTTTGILLNEQFEGVFPPPGWSAIDNEGTGCMWMRNDAWADGNYITGGADFCADCNSDAWGADEFDTELWTPSMDFSGAAAPVLSYDVNYQNFANLDFLNVDISVDSGVSWTNLLSWNEDHGNLYSAPGEHVDIDLSAYAGQPDVMIRWHYFDPNIGDWDWYAQIDNVEIVSYLPATSIGPIPAGGSMDFIARVTVPAWAGPGDFDIADITATPQSGSLVTLASEDFEGAWPPAGWTVVNYGGAGVWQRNDMWPGGRPNYAGGLGFCADADSDRLGVGTYMNTGLQMPAIDLAGISSPILEFDQSYNDIVVGGDYAEVRVSTDGGMTWTTIALYDEDHSHLGPGEHVTLSLDPFVGESNVLIEFHYGDATWDWWWEIDNVGITGMMMSNTAQVETIWPNAYPWSDDLEGSTGQWDTDGFWHMVDDLTSPYPNSYSPTHSWWYGQDATGDYDNGLQNWGRLETPSVDLTGQTEAVFSFAEWYDTEWSSPIFDIRVVQIDTGSGWVDVQLLPELEMETWMHSTVDLTPYCGNIVRLGLWFDTGDDIANQYSGWYVDNFYIGPYAVDAWPDIQADSGYWTESVDYSVTVDNIGFLPDSYDLSVSGNIWPVTLWNAAGTDQVSSIGPVPASGSTTIIARVTVPYGIVAGTWDFAQVTATSQSTPMFTWDTAIIWTESLNPFGVDLTPDFQIGTGYVGDLCFHTMTIQNTGVWNDRYDLTAAAIWPITFWNTAGTAQITQTPVLTPGATYDFVARVEVPALAAPGSWDVGNIWATSVGDPTWTLDSAQVQTFSDNPYGVNLVPDYQERDGLTGHYVDHLLTVYNTGVWPETYDLTATGNAWPVEFFASSGGGDFTLLTEGLEGAFPPTGWTHVQNNVAETWHQEGATSHSGAFSATCYYDPALNLQDEWLITPEFDLTGVTNPELSFWWMMSYYWGVTPFDNYDMNVYITTDGWGTSDLLWTEDWMGGFDNWIWYDTSFGTPVDLSAYEGMSNLQIGFQYFGVDGAQLSLDDILITGTEGEIQITGGPITTTGLVQPGEHAFIVARVHIPMGLPPGSWDEATITATSSHYFYTWDDAVIHTNGEPEYWFSVGPPVQTNFGWEGEWVEHRVQITNEGTMPDVYLPMFYEDVAPSWDADWWTKFFTVDLRPQGIYNGIDDGSETWWWGPVQPGETKEYAIKVFVPTDEIGAFDQARIFITSDNEGTVVNEVEIWTRLSMPAPFYDEFELAGGMGEFGLYDDPWLGWIHSAWTGTDTYDVGVWGGTSYTGMYSLYVGGEENAATTCKINMEMENGIASCVIRRGDIAFGSDNPEPGEDLIVEYSDGNMQWAEWHELGTFPGDGTPGEVLTPLWILPEDALSPRFQLRFRTVNGDMWQDYWHIDNVFIGAPESWFGLQAPVTTAISGPGDNLFFEIGVENYARHCDAFTISSEGNTWPTWAVGPVFRDDFNDLNRNGWTAVDEGWADGPPSNWWVDGAGVLRQTDNIYSYSGQWLPGTYLWNGDAEWSNYILAAEMMSTDNDGIGLMARYTDSDNYYRFHWSADGGWDKDLTKPGLQRRVLDVCVDGDWYVLASDNIPYTMSQWYDVEMRMLGDHIQVLIDGTVIFDVTDDSLDHGAVALYSWGNTGVYFDNVEVLAENAVLGPLGPFGPLNSGTFQVFVDVPAGAYGLSDSVAVTVTSVADPWFSQAITLTTTGGRVHNLDQGTWYMDIQPAVDAADPDDTLWAYPGTYQENVVVDKAVTIHGLDRDTTIVDSTVDATGGVPLNNILIYADDAFHMAPNTYVDQALNSLGFTYTAHYDGDFAGFEADLIGGGPWDLVIFGHENYGTGTSVFDALNTYAASGGKLIVNTWLMDGTHPLWTTMGVAYAGDDWSPPDPVFWWDPGHQYFNSPESVPQLTMPADVGYGTYACKADPLPGNTAVAGHMAAPAAGEGAIIPANGGNTIFKSFLDGQFNQDADTDGTVDGVELWINMISSMGTPMAKTSVFDIQANGVSIDGFTIQNNDVGILMTGASGCEIFGNLIQNCGGGISMVDSGNNHIHGNDIHDMTETLITGSLETTFADNNAYAGNMFDVHAKKGMTITSIDVHVDTPGANVAFDVYYRPGTYVGFENSPVGWTLAGSGTGISQGQGNPTPIDIPDFDLSTGDYGFFVYQTSYGVADTLYTDGNNVYDNDEMTITTGIGKGTPAFTGGTFDPRTWNGRIHYIAGSTGAGVIGLGTHSIVDDFSADTGQWEYYGNAAIAGGYCSLTTAGGGQVGRILYEQQINQPFTAEFDYLAGGGTGADGMAFNFFKEDYTPTGGGSIGAQDADGTTLGYAVEFDNWDNGASDPSANHIAIIQNNVNTHLVSVNDPRTEDNAWHHVKVVVTYTDITVWVFDMVTPLLYWSGTVDMTYGGLSFSAGTGGATNNHRVDNIDITIGNVIEDNQIHDNEIGALLWNTEGNYIFHNNFVDNGVHAIDNGDLNSWDGGYPIGGNYWKGFTGPDTQNGPLQNIPGADGIIDNPYVIDADSQDNYPLKGQYTTAGIVIDPVAVVGEPAEEPEDEDEVDIITAVLPEVPAEISEEVAQEDDEVPTASDEEPVAETIAPEETEAAEPVQVQSEPVQENVASSPKGVDSGYLLALLAISVIVIGMALFIRKRK